jgi:phage terminase small subunit
MPRRGGDAKPRALVPAWTLSPIEAKFVDEFLRDPSDPVAAARRAGSVTPKVDGSRFLRLGRIQGAIAYAQAQRRERTGFGHDTVLRRWGSVFNADVRELVEHWRVPCRRCWGVDHQPQMTDTDFVDARTAHLAEQMKKLDAERVPFDERGGPGYTINRAPCRGPAWVAFVQENARVSSTPLFGFEANSDHDCPNCHGHGEPYAIFHDTRYLSPGASLLYQGTSIQNGAIEVKIRNPAEVETLIARHLGMFVERRVVLVADAAKMSEVELRAELARELAEAERLR